MYSVLSPDAVVLDRNGRDHWTRSIDPPAFY